jgi:hypothetical protein
MQREPLQQGVQQPLDCCSCVPGLNTPGKEQRKPNNSAETGAEAEYSASFKGSESVLLKIGFRLDRNRISWSEFGCNRSLTEAGNFFEDKSRAYKIEYQGIFRYEPFHMNRKIVTAQTEPQPQINFNPSWGRHRQGN